MYYALYCLPIMVKSIIFTYTGSKMALNLLLRAQSNLFAKGRSFSTVALASTSVNGMPMEAYIMQNIFPPLVNGLTRP